MSTRVSNKIDIPDRIRHSGIRQWIEEMVALCKPERVHFCDGSQEEWDQLCGELGRGRHIHQAQ